MITNERIYHRYMKRQRQHLTQDNNKSETQFLLLKKKKKMRNDKMVNALYKSKTEKEIHIVSLGGEMKYPRR